LFGSVEGFSIFYREAANLRGAEIMHTAQENNTAMSETRKQLNSTCSRYLAIVVWCCLAGVSGSLSQTQVTKGKAADSTDGNEVGMTLEKFRRYYAQEQSDLEYNPSQDQLEPLLQKVGEKVEAFFANFANTASKEQVRMQRLGNEGREEDSAKQDFNYLILPHSDGMANNFEEVRTDEKGRSVNPAVKQGFILTKGFAGMSVCFHPDHRFGSHFYYLGKQTSDPYAYVVAFAQKPEVQDYLSLYTGPRFKEAVPLLLRGIAWIDPQSFQITRLRTDLLTSYVQIGLLEQTTDIRFAEIRFATSQLSMWLPQEATVNCVIDGIAYRNRHRYSDYQVFTVESYDKINEPVIKK
jgi:hypothetical protein